MGLSSAVFFRRYENYINFGVSVLIAFFIYEEILLILKSKFFYICWRVGVWIFL